MIQPDPQLTALAQHAIAAVITTGRGAAQQPRPGVLLERDGTVAQLASLPVALAARIQLDLPEGLTLMDADTVAEASATDPAQHELNVATKNSQDDRAGCMCGESMLALWREDDRVYALAYHGHTCPQFSGLNEALAKARPDLELVADRPKAQPAPKLLSDPHTVNLGSFEVVYPDGKP